MNFAREISRLMWANTMAHTGAAPIKPLSIGIALSAVVLEAPPVVLPFLSVDDEPLLEIRVDFRQPVTGPTLGPLQEPSAVAAPTKLGKHAAHDAHALADDAARPVQQMAPADRPPLVTQHGEIE